MFESWVLFDKRKKILKKWTCVSIWSGGQSPPGTSWMFNFGGFTDSPHPHKQETGGLDTIHVTCSFFLSFFLSLVATSLLSRTFWGKRKILRQKENPEAKGKSEKSQTCLNVAYSGAPPPPPSRITAHGNTDYFLDSVVSLHGRDSWQWIIPVELGVIVSRQSIQFLTRMLD